MNPLRTLWVNSPFCTWMLRRAHLPPLLAAIDSMRSLLARFPHATIVAADVDSAQISRARRRTQSPLLTFQ